MIKKALWMLPVLILAGACARQGYPSGGPKDSTPPKVLGVSPQNGSLLFDRQEFLIQFDEYVQVKDADNNVLISPPMAKKPEYVVKGRGLLVRIKDTLRPATTYLFQFKEAVADLNEGNPLPSFEYAFSTGSVIDTMELSGRVADALSDKPRENPVSVMLYQGGAPGDSLIAKEAPAYITRCDKDGRFRFTHIRPGAYRIVAVEDDDKNMKYGPTEAMAFCDSLVQAVLPPVRKADSAQADSLKTAPQTADSALSARPEGLVLRVFKSEHLPQRILKSEFLRAGRVQISAQAPFEAPSLSDPDSLVWSLSPKKDTLDIWTRNEKCDSLRLVVSDPSGIRDTLSLRLKKKKGSAAQPKTPLMRSLVKNSHPFFDTLRLRFDNPIHSILGADSLVEVLSLDDSLTTLCPLVLDSTRLGAWIDFRPKPGARYRFRIPQEHIFDLYGHPADSLSFSTTCTKESDYGTIRIALDLGPGSIVVDLLDEKEAVAAHQQAEGPQTLSFSHLAPGKYRLRAIFDSNRNARWDPGDYWHSLQPEQVLYFPKTLDLRPNWEMEEVWSAPSQP